MARTLGNVPNCKIGEAFWRQDTNDDRDGRLLIVPISFAADISDEPYIFLPWATGTTSGVQAHITVEADFPDGMSTDVGIIIAPP